MTDEPPEQIVEQIVFPVLATRGTPVLGEATTVLAGIAQTAIGDVRHEVDVIIQEGARGARAVLVRVRLVDLSHQDQSDHPDPGVTYHIDGHAWLASFIAAYQAAQAAYQAPRLVR